MEASPYRPTKRSKGLFMKRFAALLLLLALFAGCESKEEQAKAKEYEALKQEQLAKHNNTTAEKKDTLDRQAGSEEKNVQRAEPAREEPKRNESHTVQSAPSGGNATANQPSLLNKMGVSMQEGKLIIDTKQAKEFFFSIQKKLDNTSRELNREIIEKNLTMTVPMGIEVKKEKVTIDVNKTRSFFESWGSKMEAFAKEFDRMTRSLYEDNRTQQ
jgi:hypothetical protein